MKMFPAGMEFATEGEDPTKKFCVRDKTGKYIAVEWK
jgi:hypothetical protein